METVSTPVDVKTKVVFYLGGGKMDCENQWPPCQPNTTTNTLLKTTQKTPMKTQIAPTIKKKEPVASTVQQPMHPSTAEMSEKLRMHEYTWLSYFNL